MANLNYIKQWYTKSDAEIADYFDVDTETGLSSQSVLARVEKFGTNNDSSIPEVMQDIYKAWVKRDGRIERISIKYVVPGDIVLLETGCRVPADIRLLRVNGLRIDESTLTGSALPVSKNTFVIKNVKDLKDIKCIAFAGTFVAEGSGWGVVVGHSDKLIMNAIIEIKHSKHSLKPNLTQNKFRRMGVTVNDKSAIKNVAHIDTVFIDAILPDSEILELIRKVQLGMGISCVFVVSSQAASRLKRELPSAQIYQAKDIAKHVAKQILSMIIDTQFITDASYSDLLKVVGTMQQHSANVLWLTDGRHKSQVVGVASVTMIIGDIARDDNLYKADLIATNCKPIILTSILYNKK